MIVSAVIGFTMVRAIYSQPLESIVQFEGLIQGLSALWATFVGVGGICTLKRKLWGLCLFSSILLLPVVIVPFLMWSDVLTSGEETTIPFAIVITLLFLIIGILPALGVYLRKREWES